MRFFFNFFSLLYQYAILLQKIATFAVMGESIMTLLCPSVQRGMSFPPESPLLPYRFPDFRGAVGRLRGSRWSARARLSIGSAVDQGWISIGSAGHRSRNRRKSLRVRECFVNCRLQKRGTLPFSRRESNRRGGNKLEISRKHAIFVACFALAIA